ncbi:MAG: DUF4956 domain-containing protein [Muricoprocola sp.]
MNMKDYFKKSMWEAFTASSGITLDFVIKSVLAMAIAVLLGTIIFMIYKHYYGGVVYSSSFAMTLIGMTVLTCMLTLAISSNIIISLGMIGALSIVRYRTAIKDPMDLLYLFWSISVGITVAADLYVLAVLTMIVMFFMVHVFYHKRRKGVIYILVTHYEGEDTKDKVIRQLGNMKYQLKSQTIRKGITEMTVELLAKHNNTAFLEKISSLENVKDASLIQYNGEYTG